LNIGLGSFGVLAGVVTPLLVISCNKSHLGSITIDVDDIKYDVPSPFTGWHYEHNFFGSSENGMIEPSVDDEDLGSIRWYYTTGFTEGNTIDEVILCKNKEAINDYALSLRANNPSSFSESDANKFKNGETINFQCIFTPSMQAPVTLNTTIKAMLLTNYDEIYEHISSNPAQYI